MFPAILDANIHRVCEGLRVIEEYFRFVVNDGDLTNTLAILRKKISHTALPVSDRARMEARDTEKDVRAGESIHPRVNSYDLLVANFKRSQEALRVLEEYTGNDVFRIFRYELYELEKVCFLQVNKPFELRGIYLISHDVNILREGLELGADIIQLRCKEASPFPPPKEGAMAQEAPLLKGLSCDEQSVSHDGGFSASETKSPSGRRPVSPFKKGESPKSFSKQEILVRAREAKKLAEEFGKPLIINDYLDIAQIVDADGIHTGQDDLPISEIRKLWSPDKIYGRTTHSFEQGIQARDEGATYVSVGPIWATPTKPGRPAIGFEYLSHASELDIPFVAIGGINTENIEQIAKYEPPMVAVVRDYESIPILKKSFGI